MKSYFYDWDDCLWFEYEPEKEDVDKAIENILDDMDKEQLVALIMDLVDDLDDYFATELHEYFENDARDEYERWKDE